MEKNITITREEYECLRRHLNGAMEILHRLEVEGAVTAPKLSPQETRIQKYGHMLLTGKRARRPR